MESEEDYETACAEDEEVEEVDCRGARRPNCAVVCINASAVLVDER